MKGQPINIGTVVGSTSPQEYRFNLKSFGAKLGDLVNVEIEIHMLTADPELSESIQKSPGPVMFEWPMYI